LGIGIQVLYCQHRQVLGNGVTEDGAEDANIIAPSVAHSYHGRGSQLVRDTQPRSKVLPVLVDVEVAVDTPHPADPEQTGIQVEQTAVAICVYVLGVDDVPAQPKGDSQLGGRAPGVLSVEIKPLLAFGSIGRSADIALEGSNVAEQERGQGDSGRVG